MLKSALRMLALYICISTGLAFRGRETMCIEGIDSGLGLYITIFLLFIVKKKCLVYV